MVAVTAAAAIVLVPKMQGDSSTGADTAALVGTDDALDSDSSYDPNADVRVCYVGGKPYTGGKYSYVGPKGTLSAKPYAGGKTSHTGVKPPYAEPKVHTGTKPGANPQ